MAAEEEVDVADVQWMEPSQPSVQVRGLDTLEVPLGGRYRNGLGMVQARVQPQEDILACGRVPGQAEPGAEGNPTIGDPK